MSLVAYFIIWIFVILNSKMSVLKKNIFFVLFFLSGNVLFGQAVIPKFGLTVTTADFSKQRAAGDDINYKYGYMAGMGIEFPIGKVLAIQPELLFHQKGWTSNYSSPTETRKEIYRLNYMEVPLLIKAKIGMFYINAGPYAAVGIRGVYKYSDDNAGVKSGGHQFIRFTENQSDPTRYKYIDNPFDFGVAGGFGFKILNRVYLDFRYGKSIRNFYTKTNTGITDNFSRNRGFEITLGFPSPRD